MHARLAPVIALLSRFAAAIPSWQPQIITSGATSANPLLIPTPPTLAGLFFCLASTRCRAFIFPCCNTTPYKRLQLVLCCKCNYTANAAKRLTGLYRGVSYNLPHSTAADTRPTQAAIIPPAPRWSISQRRSTSSEYQIPAPRRTLYRSAQPPYYNKVYKGAGVRTCYESTPDGAAYRKPCQPGGVGSCRVWIAGKCCTC